MRKILAALALAATLTGCAGTIEGTVNKAELALVGVDVVLEELSPRWLAYVEAQVARCKALDLETRAQGVDCLGPAAKSAKVEAALEHLTEAQGATHKALEELKAVAPELEAARSAKP